MTDQHARLAPSSAHRWGPGGCPGSVALEQAYPEETDSDESREGTAAHHYVTETIAGRDPGTVAPNGHPITAEMIDAAASLITDVRDTHAAHPGAALHVEQRVSMARAVHPDNWGTPDVVLIDHAQRALHVWDYKFGHRYVDAYKNWQLIDYAIGALETFGVDPITWGGWRVSITIAQPRNYAPEGPMREWYCSGAALLEYAAALAAAARDASEPGAAYQTGPHCLDCRGAHACPALQRAGGLSLDISHRGLAVELPPAAVGLELALIDRAESLLKARRTGLEARAMGMIRSGVAVPGRTIGFVKGRERWATPAAEVAAMGDMMGVDLRKPLECITPVQARKAGVDASVIKAYAEIPTGAARLEAIDDSTAARVFGEMP